MLLPCCRSDFEPSMLAAENQMSKLQLPLDLHCYYTAKKMLYQASSKQVDKYKF